MHKTDKYIFVNYFCECGEINNSLLQVTFTAADGNRIDLEIDEDGDADFTDVESGVYTVEIFDENGETLMVYDIEIENKQPVVPEKPIEPTPEQPDEPTNPDISDEPSVPDNPEQPSEAKGGNNAGLIIGIIVALIVLAAGGATTFILIRKKNKKNKSKGDK